MGTERIYGQVSRRRETVSETITDAMSRRTRTASRSWHQETHYVERRPGATPEDPPEDSEIYPDTEPMLPASAALPRLSGDRRAGPDA